MQALCLITVSPGQVDNVVAILKKKHKVIKDILIVTGRADIGVLMQGKISEINSMVLNFRKVKDVVTTETLMEVEVNLGW